ncbi:Exonuclease VII, large subunit [Flaviramulus basaltis]|uniref:Exonuclease VII, large subunit n=1 Tax=Flaviramulus basaltis TaxID=369401 RepID=A0A1K2IAT4_9FLAO|nr:exodeoxyribonuclease VII large subunit [Flaviramulus basaltis]SFZ89532.1 Exonuclease VII, large subunit [Flaviramulus basaltis]
MPNQTANITVSILQTLYAKSLSSTLDGSLLILEGFYFHKKGKLYGKYYYDDIVSKDKQYKITAQFTTSLKEEITDGKYYQFEGFITKAQSLSNESKLNIFFRVTKILKHEKNVQAISKIEYDIIQARFERDFPLINDILASKLEKGLSPILDVIIGVQSTSEDDYMGQLTDSDYFRIRHHKCSLSSEKEILEFLKTHDFATTDLLIVLRGGGSGLEVFNNIELCKKVLELPIPFITGIGHDADKTLMEKIADRGFSTPTAVGTFLQNTINIYKERSRLVKTKIEELETFKKQTEMEKRLLLDQIVFQKKNLYSTWLVIGVFILIIGYLLYKILN